MFLNFHNQGQKSMLIAHIYRKRIGHNKKYLTEYDIIMPERFAELTKEDMPRIREEWEDSEYFKKAYGSYPFEILQIEDTQPEEKTVKKNYQILMRQNHPDKNPSETAHQITQNLTCAYEFYTKPEIRQKLNK